jgi:hypothetical protein
MNAYITDELFITLEEAQVCLRNNLRVVQRVLLVRSAVPDGSNSLRPC